MNDHQPHPSTNTWQQTLRNSLRTPKQLTTFFSHPFPATSYPVLIPLRIARAIKTQGLTGPLGLQFLPRIEEGAPGGLLDPIGDDLHRPAPGIIHRYHNRILVSPTPHCPIQCRYCFRKNQLANTPKNYRTALDSLRHYLALHPEITEVILTGGDPLIVPNHILESYFQVLLDFASIKFLRLHTRTPIVLPERITPSLLQLFQRYQHRFPQIHLVIHINHWSEADGQVIQALQQLRSAGLALMSQSVLLKQINDTTDALYQLFFNLAQCQVRPYYLHHPDPTRGAMHFYLPVQEGQKIYQPLRHRLPGWALPSYVVESPQGGGKMLAPS